MDTLLPDLRDAQAAYWRAALAGAPELLELPTDRPRPARPDPASGGVELALDAGLAAGLGALARRHGTTPFTPVLAAWAVVLSRLSGQREVVIGTRAVGPGWTGTAATPLADGASGIGHTHPYSVDLLSDVDVDTLLAELLSKSSGS